MRIGRPTLTIGFFLSCLTHSAAQAIQDIGWPREVIKNGSVLLYYQPQIDEWKDYKQLSARMAFALTPDKGRQVLGIASFTCGTLVDKDARTVYFRDIHIPVVRFPQLSPDSARIMEKSFREMAPAGGEPISLDRLTADLKEEQQVEQGVPVMTDPPPIFYSSSPAILLIVEGEPVFAPVQKTNLQFVVNTNWDLFQDKKKKNFYLLLSNGWLTAKALTGPWIPTQSLPEDFGKLPSGENFDEVKKMVPPPPPAGTVPQVFYSPVPAELIFLKGAPVYATVAGTELLYVTNTDNDIFIDNAQKEYYILLSGRWFRAKAFGGPWTYAGDDLPADFARIPENSPKGHVLPSVPGTIEASDAVMLAQIPATAVVNKAEVEGKVKVSYDGDPQFKPIRTTSLQYATNTQDKVIKVEDLYYLCFQGVWFMSTAPAGPWKTADAVPREIYSIPPGSPVYNVTYVTQTNATATTVESSSAGGYLGMFIIGMAVGACVAYGTGYYHPPYVLFGPGMASPIYRPWPCTYGIGAVYNPVMGGWAAGRAVYGPYGASRSAAWYNPATGKYGRAASIQGWNGGRTAARAYNPWTGSYASTRQGHNAYAQWGESVASRGNQWVQTGHVTTAAGTAVAYRTSSGQAGMVTHGINGTTTRKGNNDVYAGHDGNVYKKNINGSWSQYGKGGWQQPAGVATGTMNGLGSADRARQWGQARTQQFQSLNSVSGRRLGGARRR